MMMIFGAVAGCFMWLPLFAFLPHHSFAFAAVHDEGCGGKKKTPHHPGGHLRGGDGGEERTIVMLEGTEKPTFLCGYGRSCDPKGQQARIFKQIQVEMDPSARLVSSLTGIVNVLFVEMNTTTFRRKLSTSGGTIRPRSSAARMLRRTAVSQSYEVYIEDVVDEVGGTMAQETYCATGKGVKVAVLDTGVDYTHQAMGGPGTVEAYREAYGINPYSPRARERDGLFPTPTVYEGFDILGDIFAFTAQSIRQDSDPIDRHGHGTFVSHAILSMAPQAKLLAAKVCGGLITPGGAVICPDFALLFGIEYAMDPNFDGNPDDRVDIINLSLGKTVVSSYYDTFSFALENAFSLGTLSIVAFGNGGNRPYLTGAASILPNAIAVAALTHPEQEIPSGEIVSHGVASFSSRGPGEGHALKPDLAAPGRTMLLAEVGTGTSTKRVSGTSFAAPVVTGAAALLLEKCPNCSPLAIKALLMNNVKRDVKHSETGEPAPLTQSGAGELRIGAALESDYWAYSVDQGDVQPSISLGLINVAEGMIVERRILLTSIANVAPSPNSTLSLRAEFRDPVKEALGAVEVVIPEPTIPELACGESTTIVVEFHISAANAPPNSLDSTRDPSMLDPNEFGGHVIISFSRETDVFTEEYGPITFSTIQKQKEISLPFYMILRKASRLELDPNMSPLLADPDDCSHIETDVTVHNFGAGVAQVDAYEILSLDEDEYEGDPGSGDYRADIRAVGYRTLPETTTGCAYILEFVFTLWERPRHVLPLFVGIRFYEDEAPSSLRYQFYTTRAGFGFEHLAAEVADCVGFENDCSQSTRVSCSRFDVDHSPGSANIVVRVCSDQVGVTSPNTTAWVGFFAEAEPNDDYVEFIETPAVIRVPNAILSAPSYDVAPGRTLEALTITRRDVCNEFGTVSSKGVQLVTNAYRGDGGEEELWVGAGATRETETLLIPTNGTVPHAEATRDTLTFPDATDLQGPTCDDWLPLSRLCAERTPSLSPTPFPPSRLTPYPTASIHPTLPPFPRLTATPSCPPQAFPKPDVPTESPSSIPSRSLAPSQHPTALPTFTPAPSPLPSESLRPSIVPKSAAAAGVVFWWSTTMATSLMMCLTLQAH